MALTRFLLVYIIFHLARGSFLELGDNGYENVVVSFEEDLDEDFSSEDCTRILDALENWIRSGSTSLCSATQSQASIKSVVVIIPQSWETLCRRTETVSWSRRRIANIQIGRNHPLSSNRPITFQPGGCGAAGRPIYIPMEYLQNLDGSEAGLDFVHEWSHHRYGVFDEAGILNDPRYPAGFKIPGKDFEANSCTDKKMLGHWDGLETCGTESNPDCDWIVFPEENDSVESSLMYRTDLPNMKSFCNQQNHRIEAPNKHNFFCNGKSALDVVLSHADFSSSNKMACIGEPTFTFTTDSVKGYFVILDRSSAMGSFPSRFATAVESLKQFIWHLPDGVHLYLMTYNERVEWRLNQTIINDATKEKFINVLCSLPVPPTTGVANAMESALTSAATFYNEGLDYLLLTSTGNAPSNFAQISADYKEKKIPVYVVSFGLNSFPELYTLTSSGSFVTIPDWDPADPAYVSRNALTFAVGNLMSIYSNTFAEQIKIHEKGYALSANSEQTGNFYTDSAGEEIIVVFTTSSPGLSIQLSDGSINYPVEQVNGTWMWKPENKITNFTSGFTMEYTIRSTDSRAIVNVDVWIDNPGIVETVLAKAWPNPAGNIPHNLRSGPVSLHAELRQNRRPVNISGEIFAHIYGADPSNKVVLLQSIRLNDGPASLADTTGGDGIYSGYVTKFSGNKKKYPVVVELVNGRSARVCQNYNHTDHLLAGSIVSGFNCSQIPVLSNRYFYGADFQLTSTVQDDILPPNQINDLQIEWDPEQKNGTLQWTPPYDDYGTGLQVNKFVISMQVGEENSTELYRGVLEVEDDLVCFNFSLPSNISNTLIILKVSSLDGRNNPSSGSNIAAVYLPPSSLDTTTSTSHSSTEITETSSPTLPWNESSTVSSSSTWSITSSTISKPTDPPLPGPGPSGVPYEVFWGILAGFIITLVLVIVLGVFYWFKVECQCVMSRKETAHNFQEGKVTSLNIKETYLI